MKPIIKSMIWNTRKHKTTMQNKKKKEPQNMRIVKIDSGKTLRGTTFAS